MMAAGSFRAAVVFGLGVLAAGAGCSRQDGGGPVLVPATGRVVFKNEGYTGATITFLPDAEKGNRGQMATSILQVGGGFTMETYPQGAGVSPGAYKITVTVGRRPEPELQKYTNVRTTPLSVDVPEGGLKDYLIELK